MRILCTAFLGVVLLGACGSDETLASTDLDAMVETESDIAMSLPSLRDMSLTDDTSVIVPLDRAVLALDAKSLAAFASNGDLSGILDSLVVPHAVTKANLVDGSTLTTTEGRAFPVSANGDTITIGSGKLVEIRELDGATLIILDDVWNDS